MNSSCTKLRLHLRANHRCGSVGQNGGNLRLTAEIASAACASSIDMAVARVAVTNVVMYQSQNQIEEIINARTGFSSS